MRKPYHEQASTVIHVVPSMSLEKPRDAMSIDDEEEHSRNATATEQTLQEKLDALKMVDMTIATKSTSASKRAAAPKADSLQQMLVQALRTQDRQLLEECLAVGDARVIQNTVQRLPPSFVLTLLKELVQRFQSRPGRGRALARWIRAMLMFHMSYLMTVPSLADELGALYQMVDERLAHFKKLLRLQGRLDVIDHQVRQRLMATERLSADAQAMATDGSLITRQPLCVYDENEEEEAVADDLDTYDEVTDVEEEWSHLVSGAVDDDFDEDDASIDDEEEDEPSTMGDADDAREFLGFDDDEVEA